MVKSLKDIDFLKICNCETNYMSWGKIKILQKVIERKTKLCRLTGHPTTPHFQSQRQHCHQLLGQPVRNVNLCIDVHFNLISPR